MCAHVGVHLLYGHALETGGELLGVRVLSSYHRFWVSDAGLQACLARARGAPCWSLPFLRFTASTECCMERTVA